MIKDRELWVDYTKMFACILVVVGHLLQGLNKANIQWNASLYNYINTFIYIFHMPLFMCLSGYLYKKYTKINSWKEYFKFIKKKLINLGIPYLFFYLAYVFINMLFSSSVNSQKGIADIMNIFTNPMPPFWFLYALFFIFLVVPILEKILKNNRSIIFIFSILLHIFNIFIKTNIYAIDIVAEYLIYFYLGSILAYKIKEKTKNENIILYLLIFIVLASIYCFIIEKQILNTEIMQMFKIILAILGTIETIQIFKYLTDRIKNNKILNIISKNTMPIYLMHTIFSAGIRIILLKLGFVNFYLHFLTGLVFGVFGPIIVAKILEKIKYGSFIIYPINTLNECRKENHNLSILKGTENMKEGIMK